VVAGRNKRVIRIDVLLSRLLSRLGRQGSIDIVREIRGSVAVDVSTDKVRVLSIAVPDEDVDQELAQAGRRDRTVVDQWQKLRTNVELAVATTCGCGYEQGVVAQAVRFEHFGERVQLDQLVENVVRASWARLVGLEAAAIGEFPEVLESVGVDRMKGDRVLSNSVNGLETSTDVWRGFDEYWSVYNLDLADLRIPCTYLDANNVVVAGRAA